MSKTGKVLILLVIVGLLIVGGIYFKFTRLLGDGSGIVSTDDAATRQALLEGGDEDISALLGSLDEEQTQEAGLLPGEDSDGLSTAEEDLLADEINQLNQNEI